MLNVYLKYNQIYKNKQQVDKQIRIAPHTLGYYEINEKITILF